MRLKIKPWTPVQAKKILVDRLHDARMMRSQHEEQWRYNEVLLYNALAEETYDYKGPVTTELLQRFFTEGEEDNTTVNYIFKHHRFLNAQMSANPPTVQARPASSDPADKRRADAADRCCRHGVRAYSMQEMFDQNNGQTLLYGTGFMKTFYDKAKGEFVHFDADTGEFELSGEFTINPMTIWDIWLDPHARRWKDVKYVFEREWMSIDEAELRWPQHSDKLRKAQKYVQEETLRQEQGGRVQLKEVKIPVFYYFEKGLPVNGMQGRYACMLEDGFFLDDVTASPCKYPEPPKDPKKVKEFVDAEAEGKEVDRGPEIAILPFHILTDIDVTDSPYGKSFIEYAAPAQETINKLDSLNMENIAAHGYCRIVLPEGADIAEDSIKDTPWEIVRVTGGRDPHYFEVPKLMPEVAQMRDKHHNGIDDMAGVNDSMYGKQEREQSGFSMQYATNQGNMIRRRIFNKYVLLVESVYKSYLAIIQKHWKDDRTIQVLGNERSWQIYDLKGADIFGGFDLVVEYGSSLSLDPTSRREEIMALMPLFEKAGVEPRKLMEMLRLNELGSTHDAVAKASERQQEIFDQIILGDGEIYIPPAKMRDHKNMLVYCNDFLMSGTFRDLDAKVQMLIEKHIMDRILLMEGKAPEQLEPAPGQGGQPLQAVPPQEGSLGGLETPDMSEGQPLPAVPATLKK